MVIIYRNLYSFVSVDFGKISSKGGDRSPAKVNFEDYTYYSSLQAGLEIKDYW